MVFYIYKSCGVRIMAVWTENQQKVISSSAKKLICSAAAGSGKTAVMIERIVRLIREGADPFSFLVITFTNAAAAEMREKIRKRLSEERKSEFPFPVRLPKVLYPRPG